MMQNRINSGIDIDLGNQCSRIAYDWAKKTFTHREPGTGNPLMSADGGFSSLMDFHGVKIGMSSDGIGTKIELAERTGIYNTIGFDLVAMVADDLAANGIETVNLSNILDVDLLDSEVVDKLMEGLYEATKFANITVTGGEIAELGGRIGDLPLVFKNRHEFCVEVLRRLNHCPHKRARDVRHAESIQQGGGLFFGISVEGWAQPI